jgi:hypothetical protein
MHKIATTYQSFLESAEANYAAVKMGQEEGKAVRHVTTESLKGAVKDAGFELESSDLEVTEEGEFVLGLDLEDGTGIRKKKKELLAAVHSRIAPANIKWADVDGNRVELIVKGYITMD